MKKTLSMLLALAMVVAVIAMPVSAKEATGSVKLPLSFDISKYDVGYLTNDLIAGNDLIAHVGVGNSMDIKLPAADVGDPNLGSWIGGSGENTVAVRVNKTKVTGGAISENLNVSVAELDGEKVIALKGAANQPAGIVSTPIADGQLANGGSLVGSFKFMQPEQGWSNGVYLGLAFVEEDGSISYLQINEPTLSITEWHPDVVGGTIGWMKNKYIRNSSAVAWLTVGGSMYGHEGHSGKALDGEVERQVASPYYYYSMYNASGELGQSNAWGSGPYTATDKDGNPMTGYMAAMGKWMQVDYKLTAHAKGIQVDIVSHEEGSPYAGDLSVTSGKLLRFVIPMTADEIANYDGRLAVTVTAEEGTAYVKDFSLDKVNNITTELTEDVNMIDMESYSAGQTQIRDNNLYIGASSAANNPTGFGVGAQKMYAPNPYGDQFLNEGDNVSVIYNPTKGQGLGNDSNKILAVYTDDAPATHNYGWTGPYIPYDEIVNGNVRMSFDMYQAGASCDNTRVGISLRHKDGGYAGAMNSVYESWNSGFNFMGDYYNGNLIFGGTWSGSAAKPTSGWVRYNIDFSLNEVKDLILNISSVDLKTGNVKEATTHTLARNGGGEGVLSVAGQGLDYAFTFVTNAANANMAYYFDNISVTTYAKTSEKVLISSDAVETGVNDLATELYVKFASPAATLDAITSNVSLADVDGNAVNFTVDSFTKGEDGKYVLTLGLPEGIASETLYTIGFNEIEDIFGATIEDTTFYVSADWEEITPAAYSYEVPQYFKVGDTLDIAMDGYDTTYFGLNSPDGAFSFVDNGDSYTVTALKGGENTLYVSDYRVSGVADEALTIEVLNTNAVHTVTFVDGDSSTEFKVVDGESVTPPEALGGAEGQAFAGWTVDGVFVTDDVFVHVESDVTYVAAYSDPINITFNANEEEGTVTETCQATLGGVLVTLPEVTPAPGYVFAGWVAADGETVYTQAQLATVVFNEETSFTAKFDYVAIQLDQYYDLTGMTVEDLAAEKIYIENGSTYTLDENGFYTPSNWGAINFNVPAGTTGVYKFEVDFMTEAAAEDEDENRNVGMNIHYLTKLHSEAYQIPELAVQSTWINKNYSAQRTPTANAQAFANAKMVRGQEQKLEVFFDFDNNAFYTVIDGVVAMVTGEDAQQLIRTGLNTIVFDNQAGNYIKGFAFSKVEDFAVNTINVVAPEYGAIALGGRTDVATYEVPAGYAIDVAYVAGEIGTFAKWVVTDADLDGDKVIPTVDGAIVTASVKGLFAKAGDANLDGKVTVADAIEVLKHSAGITTLADDAFDNADVNADGVVNGTDATLILKYIARLILTF